MNREIKFRVWDRFKKQMSLVAKINYADDGYAKTVIVQPAPIDPARYYMIVEGESGDLMQFTGLIDKNGVEIYEGDILRGFIRNMIVSWDKPMPAFGLKSKDNNFDHSFWDGTDSNGNLIPGQKNQLEVVGNIYENPYLVSN